MRPDGRPARSHDAREPLCDSRSRETEQLPADETPQDLRRSAVGGEVMVFVRRDVGCTVSRSHDFDVTRSCADLGFRGARGLPLAAPAGGQEQMLLLFGQLLAGDALGGVERMLARATEHARERRAFGRPIGAFQAVQHRLVDHTVRVRGLSLLAEDAAAALAAGRQGAERQALLAQAAVSADAVHVLHDLVQLTGAIGFTWEHGLHLFERRAHLDARAVGNPRRALRRVSALEGWPVSR